MKLKNKDMQLPGKHVLSGIDCFLCLFLSVKFSVSSFFLKYGDCNLTFSLVTSVIMHFVFFLFLAYACKQFLRRYSGESLEQEQKKPLLSWLGTLLGKPYGVLVSGAIIFICWLPTFVMLYPGTLINDSWGQLHQYALFLNGTPLHDHHPVLTTLIIGFTINTAEKLTGNWHIAFFAYVIAQGMITSFVFAGAVSYCYRKLGIGEKAALAMLIVYCLLPVYPASVQTISKDALSGWIFVAFSIVFVEIVRTEGKALEQKRISIGLAVLGLACALTKKVNTYVCLFSIIGILIAYRRFWKKLLPSLCLITGIMLIVFPVLSGIGAITAGGKQEMFSIPFQQTARYVKEHPEDVTDHEFKVIDKVIGMENLAERYDQFNADPVKGYSERATTGEYVQYMKVWFQQGIRHPLTYLKAFDAMISGLFSYKEYIPLLNMGWHNQLNPRIIPEEAAERSRTAETARMYQEAYADLYRSPIASFFLSCGFFATIIPAFSLSVLAGKRTAGSGRKLWLAMLPLLFSLLLGCALAPYTVHFESKRYYYPLVYTEPIMIALCVYASQSQQHDPH